MKDLPFTQNLEKSSQQPTEARQDSGLRDQRAWVDAFAHLKTDSQISERFNDVVRAQRINFRFDLAKLVQTESLYGLRHPGTYLPSNLNGRNGETSLRLFAGCSQLFGLPANFVVTLTGVLA